MTVAQAMKKRQGGPVFDTPQESLLELKRRARQPDHFTVSRCGQWPSPSLLIHFPEMAV
jgi:hypothetical protein